MAATGVWAEVGVSPWATEAGDPMAVAAAEAERCAAGEGVEAVVDPTKVCISVSSFGRKKSVKSLH